MKTGRQVLSLITYNIHKGFGMGKMRFLLPQMRHALQGVHPDFMLLQEVQGYHRKRAKRMQAMLTPSQFEYMAGQEWPHFLYGKNAIYRSGHHGNAILSKYAFEEFENLNLSKHRRASRSILHGQLKLGETGKRLHLLCVHLSLFKSERASQCKAIMEQIKAAVPEKEPLLMAGDFNDWQNQLSKPLAEEMGIFEAFETIEGQHARSFPAIKPTLCVDRIYYRGLDVKSAQCFHGKPWRTLSDHLPLFAEFYLW
jgi:endonuclease/exonuclease/phosphatase family metal-dependent hydrolase